MRFQCPACGFKGGVRMPAHLPKGKTVRMRCSRCKKSFPLSLGKLFPQKYPAGYQALVPDSLDCSGTRVGDLWLETAGSRNGGIPVLAFAPHPSLPHDVMHDLLDSFGDYFRICYIEFPGTRRNPQEPGKRPYSAVFSNLSCSGGCESPPRFGRLGCSCRTGSPLCRKSLSPVDHPETRVRQNRNTSTSKSRRFAGGAASGCLELQFAAAPPSRSGKDPLSRIPPGRVES
jgi:hypothetical protein